MINRLYSRFRPEPDIRLPRNRRTACAPRPKIRHCFYDGQNRFRAVFLWRFLNDSPSTFGRRFSNSVGEKTRWHYNAMANRECDS